MKISESALRDYLRESLFGHSEPGVVNINPVVDPSASVTDPTNVAFTPQSKAELTIAIQNLLNSSNKEPSEIFELVKDTLSNSEEQEMKKKQPKIENAIRNVVKRMMNEIRLIDIAPYKRQEFIDAGAPLTGDIPQDIYDAVMSRSNKKAPKSVGPVVGDLPPVRRFAPGVSAKDDLETTTGQKTDKSKKELRSKLEKMDVEGIFTEKDVKNFSRITEKVAKSTEQLIIAVIKKIVEDFKKVVSDYNKTLEKEEKFQLKTINGLNTFLEQYVMFMSHVQRTASDADWRLVQPELEKIHTRLMDPSYVIYSGEKISSIKVYDEVKTVEQPLRLWLIEMGKKVKEFEELRGEESGSKRINISKEMFYRPLEPYFARLGLPESDIDELLGILAEVMADESPANVTNILSQKLVLTAFFTRWEVEVNEREVVDGVMLKDFFAEKQTSRGATFARGAKDYASKKTSGRYEKQANLTTDNLFNMLVTRAIYALEQELNAESAARFIKQGLPTESLERIASDWNDETFSDLIDANSTFASASYSKDEVLDLIADALADYSNVEIDL